MDKKVYKIGIAKYTSHASLNRIEAGLKSILKKLSEKHSCTFDCEGLVFDGGADSERMREIAQKFVEEKADLVISIATPTTVAMKDILAQAKINMLFYAVSDPVSAGVINSFERPGEYVTGLSDALDGEQLAKAMLATLPEAKKIGLLYNTAEVSSKMPIREAKAYLDRVSMPWVEANPAGREEVANRAKCLIRQGVDRVLTPTDNTVMSAETEILPLFTRSGIPQFTGSHAFTVIGAFMGMGGYYKNGDALITDYIEKLTIKGEKAIDMSVLKGTHSFAAVNNQTCSALGFTREALKDTYEKLGMDTLFLDTQAEIDENSDL